MSAGPSLPDLIAERAGRIAGTRDAALYDLVRASVLAAFGCTCPPDASRHDCPVHGSWQPSEVLDVPVLPSQALYWDEDPYDSYTSEERREGVQEKLRAAAEFNRSFRYELAGTVRRGQAAEEQLRVGVEHARLNGGLTADELRLAENALAAMEYALHLVYGASRHVGDQPDTDMYR